MCVAKLTNLGVKFWIFGGGRVCDSSRGPKWGIEPAQTSGLRREVSEHGKPSRQSAQNDSGMLGKRD